MTAVVAPTSALPSSSSSRPSHGISISSEPLYRPARDFSPEFIAELKKSFTKNVIKSSDMMSDLQSEAIDLIVSAIDKQRGNYEGAARQVKEQMDRKFGANWHCIIGEGFGFEVTYHMKHLMFLYYQGNVAVLLFKC